MRCEPEGDQEVEEEVGFGSKGVSCEGVGWWVLFGGVGVGLEVGLVGGGVVG